MEVVFARHFSGLAVLFFLIILSHNIGKGIYKDNQQHQAGDDL